MVWGAPDLRAARAVGRRCSQQRHPGQVGLDHRGVELGRRRPAGGDHHGGPTGGQADPEGGERRPTARPAGRGRAQPRWSARASGQRGRPRAGAHHGVGHAAPHPLVDQGGGEGRLDGRIPGPVGRPLGTLTGSLPMTDPRTLDRSTTAGRRHGDRARPPGAGPRLHPDRSALGRPGRAPGRRPPGGRGSTCPATAARRTWPPTWSTGAHLLGAAGGTAATYLGYSMGARFCLHLALARPDLVRRLVLISGTAGIERRRRTADPAGRRRGPGRRLDPGDGATARTRSPTLRRPVAGQPDVRRRRPRGQRVRRAAAQHAGGPGLEPAPGRDRAPRNPCGTGSAGSAMPVLVITGGRRHQVHRPRAAAGDRHRTDARRSWSPAPATPPTCSGPVPWPRPVRSLLAPAPDGASTAPESPERPATDPQRREPRRQQ